MDTAGQFLVVCDSCDSRTANVFCMSDGVFLCQGCDAEIHSNRIAMRHLRVPYTQCPIWAYREAKSKGRLREGVCCPNDGQQQAATPAQQDNQPSMMPNMWGSAAIKSNFVAPQQPQQGWLGAGEKASCQLSGLNNIHLARTEQAHQLAQHTTNSALNHSTLQHAGDTGSASSFRTVTPDADQAMGWANPHMHTSRVATSLPSRPVQQSSNGTASDGPANTPNTASGALHSALNHTNSLNHNLVSLLEEFKLPDGSHDDNLLLELPPSPPSVAQCFGANQHQFQSHFASQAMDVRQQLPGSLKSTYTALATSAPDFDGRSSLLQSSPCSQSMLASSLHQQQQPRDMLAMHMAQQTQQLGTSALLPYQSGSLPVNLASCDAAIPTTSISGGTPLQSPVSQQHQPGYTFHHMNRSNPLPIGNSGSLAVGMRNGNAHPPANNTHTFVRGMMAPEDEQSNAPRPSLIAPAASISELGSQSNTLALGATPDNSQHGSCALAAFLGGRGGGVASLDDVGLANLAASTQAPVFTSGIGGGRVHGAKAIGGSFHAGSTHGTGVHRGSFHSGSVHGGSLFTGSGQGGSGIGGSVHGGSMHGGSHVKHGVSLLIETASAASIEARAQALINSSSRTQQAPVFDPSIVMRIERPDGTIRELDPERAMQLHRYRQKRLARMKAFTEGQKKIRYECRKQLADSRPRVRGRFAKVGSFENLSSLLSDSSSMGVGEHSMRGANSYAQLMQTQRIDEDGLYDAAAQQAAAVRNGSGKSLSGGSAPLGGSQALRRAASCTAAPAVGISSRGGASMAMHQRQHGLHPVSASAPHSMLGAAAATPPGSSDRPSAGSPQCLASTCHMAPQQEEMPVLPADLDAAIAAAYEQECVTDQELAALGFGPITQPQEKSPRSEGSSESMSTSTAKHQHSHAHNSQQQQQQQQHGLREPHQTNGRMSSPLPVRAASFPAMLPPFEHFRHQQQHYHDMPQQQHMPLSMCIDSDAGNEFADQQVSSMLDELLQEAPNGFAL